jgi:hypothetical protein
MKRKLTLFSMATFISLKSFAQDPITLTSDNFPILNSYNTISGVNINNLPFGEGPLTWDFGTTVMPFESFLAYPVATDPFFTGSCDTYRGATRTALSAVYDVDMYWTKNNEFFGENAWHIHPTESSLLPFTGVATDKVVIPEYRQIFDVSREILRFPVTMGSTNSSDSRRITNFILTLGAYGINDTPGQLVTHVIRHDTIVTYGKMSVYTPNGPSAFYDVLAMKSWQYEIDSFYLGGAPAPPALLSAFGLSQGQNDVGDRYNRIYFYRAHNSAPFMLINFFDSPFEYYQNIFIHGDNLSMASTEELENNYNVFIYPNPTSDNKTNFEFYGKSVSTVNYTVHDLTGKLVNEVSNLSVSNNKLTVEFGSDVENGTYIVKITDTNGQVIANEKISVK